MAGHGMNSPSRKAWVDVRFCWPVMTENGWRCDTHTCPWPHDEQRKKTDG